MKYRKKGHTEKLWKIMKICTTQGVIALMLFGVSVAKTSNAQLLDREVTIHIQNVPFEKALKELEAVAHVSFVYSSDQLGTMETVSVDASSKSLRDILNTMLGPRNIRYRVHEKEATITLKREEDTPPGKFQGNVTDRSASPLMQVTGSVTDATTHQPMPGVNVIVKGTSNGTTTDADGKFAINAESGSSLLVSFIGYSTIELKMTDQTVLAIELTEDVKHLNEVEVNAGYYTTTRELQTGNIARIEAKDIEKQPVSNPLASLIGRVPGLEISQTSGVPGGNFTVRIRGTNSIANGNDPLYVVDGVPFTSTTLSLAGSVGSIVGTGASPLNTINPSDIESIEVLKDADATAIYGSRASNGVILITTKRGKAGKTRVDVNYYDGAGTVVKKMDLLSRDEYLQMRHEAFANDGEAPTVANARDLLVWDTTRYTDWQKKLMGGTARTTDAQVSISGGEKNTQFSIGGGYHRETTVFPGSNSDQRISFHSTLSNLSTNQKLKTDLSFTYSSLNTNLIKSDLTMVALTLPPIAPATFNDDGTLSWTNWSSTYLNPYSYTKQSYEAHSNNLVGNMVLTYSILPNLDVKSSQGYTSMSMRGLTMSPISSVYPDPLSKHASQFSSSSFQNWIVEPQANWRPKLGQGQFNVLAGATFLNQVAEGLGQNASGFTSEALMKNISAATTRTIRTDYYNQYRYQAFFGRINYSYKGKYLVNLTGRRDGSSRFGPGRQFANFGAAGVAWIFSEEGFIKNSIGFLSFGKLRGSYGTTGNDQLGDYQYLDSYSSSGGPYQGVIGLHPDRLSNRDFAWEVNRKVEGGIELGFLDNRIMTSFSYYRNRSSNQLIGSPLPTTAGFTTIQANFPAVVQNKGIEIELTTRNIQSSNFTWTTSINFSRPRNKLVQFPNLANFPAYANRYTIGQPLAAQKLYQYTGIDPVTGLYTVRDVNEDGTYDFQDKQTVKFVGRDYYGGVSNSFKYKGFQLDFLFQYVKQTAVNYDTYFYAPGAITNEPTIVLTRQRMSGDAATIQRYTQSVAGVNASELHIASDDRIADASFIRLKNLSVSYSLPSDWTHHVSIESARIFVQGQNLILITSYKGLDPESQGVSLPPLRVLTAGIHFTL